MDVICILIGAAVTGLVCANAQRIGAYLGVLAEPDKERRLHRRPTPQVGGVAILAGLLLWFCVTPLSLSTVDRHLLAAVALCSVGVGALGFADDQTGLSPIARIVMIFVFVMVAFLLDHELIAPRLNWGSFEPTSIPLLMYIPLMALVYGGIVNAVNMADGQDGIVGSMFIAWSLCLVLITTGFSQAIATMICVSSVIFLIFNLGGKLFLGDCGSYGVTFVLGLLVTLAHARGRISLETIMVWFFIPVADCLRLLVTRPLRGLSPFMGDRDHFHHRLELKMGKQKGLACYAAAVVLSSLTATLAPRFALVSLCVLSAFYFSFAWLTNSDAAVPVASQTNFGGPGNVVSLSSNKAAEGRRQGVA